MVKMRLFIPILLLAALVSFARANSINSSVDSNCQPSSCNSLDVPCMLMSLGSQVSCQFSKSASDAANSATGQVFNVTYALVVSNPPITDSMESAHAGIVSVLSAFFLMIIVWNALGLVVAGSVSYVSRFEAKSNTERAIVGLLVVQVSSPIYQLLLQFFSAFSGALKPSESEVNSISGSLVNPGGGMIFSGIVALCMVVFLIVIVLRWVVVVVGFFIFPVAVALDSAPFLKQFGEMLKRLVVGNFVIQLVDLVLLRTVGFIVSNPGGLLDFGLLFSYAAVLGVVVLLIAINFKFYFGSIANTVTNALVYKGVNALSAGKSDGFPQAFSK